MAEILKQFRMNVDLTRSLTYDEFELVEGDNGNVLILTLTDDNVPVDLTGAIVRATFAHSKKTFQQDSNVAESGVVIGTGTGKNEITIRLKSQSYSSSGSTLCELQIYSGDGNATLVTTQYFAFTAHRSMTNDETIQAQDRYPILLDLIEQCNALLAREQVNYTETDNTKPTFIKNKPVVGTDVQDATQNLTAETVLADADTFAGFKSADSVHRKWSWLSIKSAIKTFLFGDVTGLAKLDGAGNVSAAAVNTDYAAALHASRHASGSPDAVSATSIGAVSVAAHTYNDSEKTQIRTNINAAKAISGVLDAEESYIPINVQTGSYTAGLSDNGKDIWISSASACTFTIPNQATVAFPAKTWFCLTRGSSGSVSIAGASGVAISSAGSRLKVAEQNGTVMIRKLSANSWIANGSLSV